MKIYTRKGDDGSTGLWNGGLVQKWDGRPDAYGSLDEAASALGLAGNVAKADPEWQTDIVATAPDR